MYIGETILNFVYLYNIVHYFILYVDIELKKNYDIC